MTDSTTFLEPGDLAIGLDAPNIRGFFECTNDSADYPVEEFRYANQHPLQVPNFIQELNHYSYQANVKLQRLLTTLSPQAREKLIIELTNIATEMGVLLGESKNGMSSLNDDESERCLFYMRKLYRLYKTIVAAADK